MAQNINEVELALWFHDAIYKPFSGSNESDSADWAKAFLKLNGVSQDSQNNIHNLIMATSYSHIAETNDERLIADIDLAILGANHDRYADFQTGVRKEYSKVPSIIFMKKRKDLLATFLKKNRIFTFDWFYDEFEKQARKNISQELKHL